MEWLIASIAVGFGVVLLIVGVLMEPIRSDKPYRKPRKWK